jgi:hypothetical protein
MPRPGFCCALLLLAGAWTFSARAADEPAATQPQANAPPPGVHDVKTAGGATIRVADQGGSGFHGDQSTDDNDKYDPQSADYSRTSSFAHKSFDTSGSALSQNETAAEARDNKRFLTQPYATGSYKFAGRSFETAAYNDSAHPDAELNKSFTLPAAYEDGNQTFNTGKKSEYQDKTASIVQAAPKIDPFSAPGALTEKTFFDPTTLHVPHKSFKLSNSVRSDPNSAGTITDLPNRPLTVDEVRNLVNHEQIPDLNAKSDEPSKPLNDLNWTPPEVAPPAPDDRPVKPGPTTEDKSDELPSPGMMAEPPPASTSR